MLRHNEPAWVRTNVRGEQNLTLTGNESAQFKLVSTEGCSETHMTVTFVSCREAPVTSRELIGWVELALWRTH